MNPQNQTEHLPPALSEIWAILKETALLQKENERRMREGFAELEKQGKETDRRINATNQQIGGITRSNGEFCEEYFINSFKANPTFLGEKFDHVVDSPKPDPMVVNDQYDLVLRNGTTVALIEMKYKANIQDVKKMFAKLDTYRQNFPHFKDYRVYLCLASFRFPEAVRTQANAEGIVLIEQRGDKNEVVTNNLKTW